MSNKISGFFGDYRFLSNFYPSPIVDLNHRTWKTVEHAYQGCKAITEEDREMIRNAVKPGDAKRLGARIKIRPDWETAKLGIMYNYVTLKFQQNPELAKKLKDTGDAFLCEENYWNDRFWGICKGVGENNLGKILMEVRDSL